MRTFVRILCVKIVNIQHISIRFNTRKKTQKITKKFLKFA